MSGRAARRRSQLLELVSADDDSLRLLVESVDRDVAYEELSAAVEEHAERWAWTERVIAGLPLPVVVTDEDGAVVEADARLSALLAVPLHRLLGEPLAAFVAPADREALAGWWRHLGPDDRCHELRLRLRGPDGREHAVVLVGLPERRAQRPCTRWFVATDETATARHDHALAEAVAQLAVLPQAYPGSQTRALLRSAVSFVAPLVPAAAGSSLTLGEPTAPRLQLSDSAFSQRVDALEVYVAEGPCVDAYRGGSTVVSVDVRHDPRWPALSGRAPDVGLAGCVAVPVTVRERAVGVLNVYALEGRPVGEDSVRVSELLAGALGALLAVLHERTELVETGEQLREALRSRPVIDQAKGIVMAGRSCSADEAFRLLVRHSRSHNVKVRDLAAELVATPGLARGLG